LQGHYTEIKVTRMLIVHKEEEAKIQKSMGQDFRIGTPPVLTSVLLIQ